MKVGFITMEKFDNRARDTVGSSRIRARWVYDVWDEAEEYQIGQEYDVLIFQKVYWENMMLEFKGLKILDLCDPDWLEGKDVMKYAELCDAVTTSSEPLAEYIRQFVSVPVVCIPDRVNLEEHTPIKTEHAEKPKSVVWFGYQHNQHYLKYTLNYLIKHNLSLTVISNYAYDVPPMYDIKIDNLKFAYPKVHGDLIENDIALLPLTTEADVKGQYKSNNKTLTCWALGIPVARTPDELEELLPKEAREQESKKRLQEIQDKWDVQLSVKEYKSLISQLQNDKKN